MMSNQSSNYTSLSSPALPLSTTSSFSSSKFARINNYQLCSQETINNNSSAAAAVTNDLQLPLHLQLSRARSDNVRQQQSTSTDDDQDYQHDTPSYRSSSNQRTTEETEIWRTIVTKSIEQQQPIVDTAADHAAIAVDYHQNKTVDFYTTQAANTDQQNNKQQTIHKTLVIDNQESSSNSNQQQQQQKYNFQYQDEMSRMRERLFRLLSKVPIHVETEAIGSSDSSFSTTTTTQKTSLSASTSTSSSNKHRPQKATQNKVIDREPLIIKYYKDRTLTDLIEQHFGCSLIKHNYEHREPLMNQMELVFSGSSSSGSGSGSSSCSNNTNHHPDYRSYDNNLDSSLYVSNSRENKQQLELMGSGIIPSHDAWSTPFSQSTSPNSTAPAPTLTPTTTQTTTTTTTTTTTNKTLPVGCGPQNQPVSWHHLSMDNSVWKQRESPTKLGSNSRYQMMKQRNGSLDNNTAAAAAAAQLAKGKSGRNHHHHQLHNNHLDAPTKKLSNLTSAAAKGPKRPSKVSSAAIANQTQRVVNVIQNDLLNDNQHIYRQPNNGQVDDFECSRMKLLEIDHPEQQQQQNNNYYTVQQPLLNNLDGGSARHQSITFSLPRAELSCYNNNSIQSECGAINEVHQDHFDPVASSISYHSQQFGSNVNQDHIDAMRFSDQQHQQQPLQLSLSSQTVADNCVATDWSNNLECQLLNDVMQQQQQQKQQQQQQQYTDTYYPVCPFIVTDHSQPVQVIPTAIENWHPPLTNHHNLHQHQAHQQQQQLMDETLTETRVQMIEQQQITSEIATNINNEYNNNNCIDMVSNLAPPQTTTVATFTNSAQFYSLPMTASSNHNQSGHLSVTSISQCQAQNQQQQQQQQQYQYHHQLAAHPNLQLSDCIIFNNRTINNNHSFTNQEATNLSHSSSTGSI